MWRELFKREEENPYLTVLSDGTSVVDTKRLLQDPKVKETLRKLAAKIQDGTPFRSAGDKSYR